MRQASKHELAAAQRSRYLPASAAEKGRLLDEFVAATGDHRQPAVRLLRAGPPPPRAGHGGRQRNYEAVVDGALRQGAEASAWLGGKRLAPLLDELVPALADEGALSLAADVRERRMPLSAASIDRHLRTGRWQRRPAGLSTTKPGSRLKRQVPVQTYPPWDQQPPGLVEIDLVAHCGTSTAGCSLNPLTVTDVATSGTEGLGVWGQGQAAVFAALEPARARLPMPLLGIDADNGSELLNALLVRWGAREQLTFTRSRPDWKNDQAHVEQKNWSVVRRLLGDDR